VEQFDGIDSLVLGCTHYPLLREVFAAGVPAGVNVIDPAAHVAERFADWLARHPEFVPSMHGRLRVLCSGDTARFARHAARFLGEQPPKVERVAEYRGRLTFASEDSEPMGQFVRG
jgi:glutamate racemase